MKFRVLVLVPLVPLVTLVLQPSLVAIPSRDLEPVAVRVLELLLVLVLALSPVLVLVRLQVKRLALVLLLVLVLPLERLRDLAGILELVLEVHLVPLAAVD